jgi:pimeloyl-ACP methyl ester carboxylesterase
MMERIETIHNVTVKEAHIAVRESGSGSPMLMLHGSPDTGEMWLPLMERLTDHARTYAPDLPGFGASTLPSSFALTLDNMADFIRDLIVALAITEPVVLVMTDFGGHYGLAFATKYPQMVRGIAISNTNFFTDYQWHSFAKMYRMPLLGEFLMASTSKFVMSKSLKGFAPALPDSYIDSAYAVGIGSPSVRKTVLKMYRARNSADFAGWDAKLIALLDEKPGIVLWGDRDPFIDPAYADRFGAAQVHHFNEFSHWLPLEAPDQVAERLIAWLDSM